jgi:hypothetical protein
MGVCIGVFAYVFYGFLLRITTGCIFVKILGHMESCLSGAYVQIKGGGFGTVSMYHRYTRAGELWQLNCMFSLDRSSSQLRNSFLGYLRSSPTLSQLIPMQLSSK